MTLVEQYAQSITDRTRARQALVASTERRLVAAPALGAVDVGLNAAYHLACRARFADAFDYCAEMRAAYVACGVTR